MNELLKKLNFKNQQNILLLNMPSEFESQALDFASYTNVERSRIHTPVEMVLIFCKTLKEIENAAEYLEQLLVPDAVLWYCYPKKSSKKYHCEFDRDHGWPALGNRGYESVRMVAIDNDWSALRFRKVDLVKKFTRNKDMVLSAEGLARKEIN